MTIFDTIKKLSVESGKTLQSVAEDIGFSKNLFYRWKTSEPKAKDIIKVADYFGVTTDYLLGRSNDKYALSNKEKMDIGRMADNLLDGLQANGSVNFYGEPMTDEDKASMKVAILVALEQNKIRAKKEKDKNKD